MSRTDRLRNWMKIKTVYLPGDVPLRPGVSLTPYDPQMRQYDRSSEGFQLWLMDLEDPSVDPPSP